MLVKTAFHRFSKRAAVRIVGGLLLANMVAFLATDLYVEKKQASMSVDRDGQETSLIREGWQVMHWTYSLLEYFKHANPVDGR